MNLRDKLRAVNGAPKKAPPPPARLDCWHGGETRPIEKFPRAFDVRRETVMLMQGEDMPEPFSPERILYLDTETTGLSGGAGTVAFLVGMGWLTPEGFELRQVLMRDYPEEKYLLREVEDTLRRFDVICTFNGKSFDVPLLRDRLLMNRMDTACLDKPHIDLLHMARRVWKLRLKRCNLGNLEEAILGMGREDDLPGSLVPERYFSYLKTGQFDLLRDVIRHNAQDITSLCVLLGHMAWLYEHPEEAVHAEDVFSMGVALDRMRHPEEARKCYRLAAKGTMRTESQLRLAVSYRRGGERSAAAAVWQGMIDRREGGVTPYIELAKYYEHVCRDIPKAIACTQQAIILLAEPTLLDGATVQNSRNALQYRYDRLKRKQRSCD